MSRINDISPSNYLLIIVFLQYIYDVIYITSAPRKLRLLMGGGGSMTTLPDPTEREGPGRRMTRGREAPPGERLGKLGQHPPTPGGKTLAQPQLEDGGKCPP
jgi:hypothetical protein